MRHISRDLALMVALFTFAGCDSGHSSKSSTESTAHSSSSAQAHPLPTEPLASWIPKGTVETLPQLSIYTENAALIGSKEEYISATYTLTDPESIGGTGSLNIRGRGNSTWQWPKKPYRLKLEEATELLGMAESKHWVLLANFSDKTLMRNDLAFAMSRAMGLEYTPDDRYIQLYINDQYEGVYQLVEQIRLAKNRINVPELESGETDPDLITGSYLLEMDFRMLNELCIPEDASLYFSNCVNGVNVERNENFCVDSTVGMTPICAKEPDNLLLDENLEQKNYLENYLVNMETTLFSSTFSDPTTGYAAYFDVDSVVDYFIINEFFKNVDGASASFFMVKKRQSKLSFGPIWDFDLAMGNDSLSPDLALATGWYIRNSPWYSQFFSDPAFEAKVKNRWRELKNEGVFDQILQYIPARAKWLEKVQAENFERWALIDGVSIFEWRTWFNQTLFMPGSFDGEVQKLLDWQVERYLWLDKQFSH